MRHIIQNSFEGTRKDLNEPLLLFVREVGHTHSSSHSWLAPMLLNSQNARSIPEHKWNGWVLRDQANLPVVYEYIVPLCQGSIAVQISDSSQPRRREIIGLVENELLVVSVELLLEGLVCPFWIAPSADNSPAVYTLPLEICLSTAAQSPDLPARLDVLKKISKYYTESFPINYEKAASRVKIGKGCYLPATYSEGNIPCVLHLKNKVSLFSRRNIYLTDIYLSNSVDCLDKNAHFFRESYGIDTKFSRIIAQFA